MIMKTVAALIFTLASTSVRGIVLLVRLPDCMIFPHTRLL
jgi:hypothetical protein